MFFFQLFNTLYEIFLAVYVILEFLDLFIFNFYLCFQFIITLGCKVLLFDDFKICCELFFVCLLDSLLLVELYLKHSAFFNEFFFSFLEPLYYEISIIWHKNMKWNNRITFRYLLSDLWYNLYGMLFLLKLIRDCSLKWKVMLRGSQCPWVLTCLFLVGQQWLHRYWCKKQRYRSKKDSLMISSKLPAIHWLVQGYFRNSNFQIWDLILFSELHSQCNLSFERVRILQQSFYWFHSNVRLLLWAISLCQSFSFLCPVISWASLLYAIQHSRFLHRFQVVL